MCPLLPGLRDVPEHRVVAGLGAIGDDVFRSYFVIQTPEMLERYERHVAPAAALVDEAALERIGERWRSPRSRAGVCGSTVVVAGRLDSTVGYAAATDLLDHYPHASLAVSITRATPTPTSNRNSCAPSSPSGSRARIK